MARGKENQTYPRIFLMNLTFSLPHISYLTVSVHFVLLLLPC